MQFIVSRTKILDANTTSADFSRRKKKFKVLLINYLIYLLLFPPRSSFKLSLL
ncbi:hypothetical protein BD408DRAFT_408364, partial [Parasitella parasitica]